MKCWNNAKKSTPYSWYFKLLNVRDCAVKLLSYTYTQWIWCSPPCKQSNVGHLSRDRLVQGCFYLANIFSPQYNHHVVLAGRHFQRESLPHLHPFTCTVKIKKLWEGWFFHTQIQMGYLKLCTIKNKQQQIKPLNLIFLTFNYQNNIQNIVKCHLYSSSFPYIQAILR